MSPASFFYPPLLRSRPQGHAAVASLPGRCLRCFDVFDISLTLRHGA